MPTSVNELFFLKKEITQFVFIKKHLALKKSNKYVYI